MVDIKYGLKGIWKEVFCFFKSLVILKGDDVLVVLRVGF